MPVRSARSAAGLDLLRPDDLPGRSVALLTHYAAVDMDCRPAPAVVSALPGTTLRCILSPQHGYWGETQDNMIEWEGYVHPYWGVPVHSLYGAVREPAPGMLAGADCVVVDLQDVGSRYYTYVHAMALTMRAAAREALPVVVLDRHNPVGTSVVEGRPQLPDCLSYVGMYPIPVRHAMTPGELARHFADCDGIPRPGVVPLGGGAHESFPADRPWVHPSPNMPTPATALVYPGMCLLEGTNLSEGRGTCRPFETFGAPWLDETALTGALSGSPFAVGADLLPHRFIPTSGKHAGLVCRGAIIRVADPVAFRPLRLALGILSECFASPGTAWSDPPYEYVWDRMPIDILTGDPDIRRAVEERDTAALLAAAAGDPAAHAARVGSALLYERSFTA